MIPEPALDRVQDLITGAFDNVITASPHEH